MRHMHYCGHGPFGHFFGRHAGPSCNAHDRDDERRDPADAGESRSRYGGGFGHPRRRGARGPLDYGELRLLVLAMLADAPRHGYELMKAIGERTGGSYQPSPGVIYPTLSWLEDMGFAVAEAETGGRKRFRITEAGEGFLTANGKPLAEILARVEEARGSPSGQAPADIAAAMEELKLALRAKLAAGGAGSDAVATIAAAIRAAAAAIRGN